jgi:hypothetical protein
LPFIDWTRTVYDPLANLLGPVWGGIATGIVFVAVSALFVCVILAQLMASR